MSPLKNLKLRFTLKNTSMRTQSDKRFRGLVFFAIVRIDKWGLGQRPSCLNYEKKYRKI